MISKDLRLEQLDPRHFANLMRVWDPPEGAEPAPSSSAGRSRKIPTGPFYLFDRFAKSKAPGEEQPSKPILHPPVVALVQGATVIRIFKLGGGKLASNLLGSSDLADLRDFREAHQIPFVCAIDLDHLPQIWAEVQTAVSLEDDMVAQQLSMVRVVRRAIDAGQITLCPRLFGSLPIPSFELLQRVFDHMLPDGHSLVFYIIDGSRIWTSLIVSKRQGDVDLITSHQAIADEIRFSNLRMDAPKIIAAVKRRFAPPHIGIFLPLHTWHKLVNDDRSAIARAVAARQAILHPCPAWLLALVGAGAVSEAAGRSARLAGQLLARSGLFPAKAEKLMQSVANPLEGLGIDPWDLMRWGREWSRRVLPLF